MKTKLIGNALATALNTYDQEIDRIAELARDQLVPYFQKRGWSYITGNGTWLISDRRGRPIDDRKLPAAVHAMLYLEVAHGQYLGYFIRDITLGAP